MEQTRSSSCKIAEIRVDSANSVEQHKKNRQKKYITTMDLLVSRDYLSEHTWVMVHWFSLASFCRFLGADMKLWHVLEPRFLESEAHQTRTPVRSTYDAMSDTDIWVGHDLSSGRAEKSEKWVLISLLQLPLQKWKWYSNIKFELNFDMGDVTPFFSFF